MLFLFASYTQDGMSLRRTIRLTVGFSRNISQPVASRRPTTGAASPMIVILPQRFFLQNEGTWIVTEFLDLRYTAPPGDATRVEDSFKVTSTVR